MSDKKVTSQDFSERIREVWHQFSYNDSYYSQESPGKQTMDSDGFCSAVNALLSQARKEARREALKEMDEAHGAVIQKFRQEPFDVAVLVDETKHLLDLRSEYQQP